MRRTLESIAIAAFLFQIWITYSALTGPHRMSDRIPTHFGFDGRPDGWSSPTMLLQLPAITIGIYLFMVIIGRFPQCFNYPVPVTPENRPRMEAITISMLIWMRTELVCFFSAIQWSMIHLATGAKQGFLVFIEPMGVAIILGTVCYFFFATYSAGKSCKSSF